MTSSAERLIVCLRFMGRVGFLILVDRTSSSPLRHTEAPLHILAPGCITEDNLQQTMGSPSMCIIVPKCTSNAAEMGAAF